MIDQQVQSKYTQTPTRVAGVRFQKLGRLYHFDCSEFPELQPADYVVIETARGRQMGQVMGFLDPEKGERDYKPILRVATPRDLMLKSEWESRQLEALITCREKAYQIGGFYDCKILLDANKYDRRKLPIIFIAQEKK